MRNWCLLVPVALALTGCAHKKHVRIPSPPSAPAAPPRIPQVGDTETGLASWYGHPYHGRAAANGEIYDMETLVAAHRTLAFDTWVRVVNLTNDRTVEVRIIDRGPFVDGRIIDLSHAAAKAIDMIGPGTAQVRVEILRMPAPAGPVAFAVQVGAFQNRANADQLRARMASQYGSARLVLRQGAPSIWRVLVGSETTEDEANALSGRIRAESREKNAFVVRLDLNAPRPTADDR
jgi:peptidoglycan lytic transglycosylase